MSVQRPPTSAPPTPDPARKSWSLFWLALLPAACCGLPLLLGAVATIGTAAAVGGGIGLALAVVAGGAIVVAHRRRRRACAALPFSTKPGHQ